MEINEAQQKIKMHFEKSGFIIWPRFVVLARLEEEISEIGRILFS
ncbi:MAG: hypothetical protein ABIJ21_07940 [Nanoarchaeota archaeon]